MKPIAIIDCGSTYIPHIQGIIKDFGRKSQVIKQDDMSSVDFSSFAAIVISGNPRLITDIGAESYTKKFEFIKDLDLPVLGICNGHQVLGLIHGAKLSLGPKVKKMEEIEIINSGGIFEGVENGTEFQEEHREHITLPSDFTLLAKSVSCDNEAMRHRSKPLYGIQFHPEVSGEAGKQLIGNFLKKVIE